MNVPDAGSKSSRLVLIGEAPGDKEMEAKTPFVGPSYTMRLRPWWRRYGLPDRDGWYITNVLDYKPKDIDKVSRPEMERAGRRLAETIASLEDPWVLCPQGNYALYLLTGKGKVSWHMKDGQSERPGITSWRGSILEYVDLRGRHLKVISSIHPAATFENPKYEKACLYDWARIGRDQHFRELRITESEHRIRPTRRDVKEFVREALTKASLLSYDIETPRKLTPVLKKNGQPGKRMVRGEPYFGCIGFAFDERWSLTIPTTAEYWTDPDDLAFALGAVGTLLASPIAKVGQNSAGFDNFWLSQEGYPFDGYLWDTRAMHQTLDPRDRHDLAYLASIFTRRPFWKDEAKDPDEVMKWASNADALWSYCGMDVCGTLEIQRRLYDELRAADMLWFYDQAYAQLFPAALDVSLHGLRVDAAKRDAKRAELIGTCDRLTKEIAELAGFPLVAKKAVSGDRLAYFLHGPAYFPDSDAGRKKVASLQKRFPNARSLELAIQKKRDAKTKERRPTVDEAAVRKLMRDNPELLTDIGTRILDHRRNLKLAEFVDEAIADADGRIRCELSPITEPGRLAAKENPKKTGRNLQNIDRELRDVFIPDEDAA